MNAQTYPVSASLSDSEREKLIAVYSWLSVHELGRDERIAACQRMAALIRGRSPAMVRRMEIAKFGRALG